MTGSNLSDLIALVRPNGLMADQTILGYLRDLLSAVKYLHGRGIYYLYWTGEVHCIYVLCVCVYMFVYMYFVCTRTQCLLLFLYFSYGYRYS